MANPLIFSIFLVAFVVNFSSIHGNQAVDEYEQFGQDDKGLAQKVKIDPTNWRYLFMGSLTWDHTDLIKLADSIVQKVAQYIRNKFELPKTFINDPLFTPALFSFVLISNDFNKLYGIYTGISNSSNIAKGSRYRLKELKDLGGSIRKDMIDIDLLIGEAVNMVLNENEKIDVKKSISDDIYLVKHKIFEFRNILGEIQVDATNGLITLNGYKQQCIETGIFHTFLSLYHGASLFTTAAVAPHIFIIKGVLFVGHLTTVGFAVNNYRLSDKQIEEFQKILAESKELQKFIVKFDFKITELDIGYANHFANNLPDKLKNLRARA